MDNKPICKIDEEGNKRWYLGYKFHRLDGPAIEYPDGHKQWWINGKLHRLDGPAYIGVYGNKNWYINNHHVTLQITKWAKENNIHLDNLTEVDKLMIKLVWAEYRIK